MKNSRSMWVVAGLSLAAITGCGATASTPKDSPDGGVDATSPGAPLELARASRPTPAGKRKKKHDASVLQFHDHVNRDGNFLDPELTRKKAATFHLDTSFSATFSGDVYASPLYVEDGVAGDGTFYVATENASVYAFSEATGAVVWSSSVGTPATRSGAGCGNISPVGITGTPAIDLASRLMVFDATSADSSGNVLTHTIYGMSIDTGAVSWSVDVSTLKDPSGLTFSPQPQIQRGAVLIVGGIAYVPFGGNYGDCGSYHGWVVGVPLTGVGATAWATTVPGAGIWGVGGPASDGESVFVTTGNGFDSSMTWAESEGLFRLDPGPTFTQHPKDFFTPYNWYTLDSDDLDLSGSGPLVIDAPSMTPSKLLMAQGKDGYLYLVKRDELGGIATSSELANVGALQVQSGQISNGGAWATISGTTYVVVRPNGTNAAIGCPSGMSGDLVAVKLDPTAPQKMSVVWCATSNGIGSPSITTTDGSSNPLVWAFGAGGGTSKLYAWDLETGVIAFAGGTSADEAPNVRKFTTPIAVHSRVFVAGDNGLYAYAAE